MIRVFQNVLFVLGATSAGLAWGAGLAFLLGLGIFPPVGRDDWGALIGFTFLAACGSVIGVIIGLVGSIFWIKQRATEPWTLTTWIGMLVGLAAGIALRVSNVFDASLVAGDLMRSLPATLVFLAMTVFLGGILGSVVRFAKSKDNP
jgi:hypothetical protein